MREINLETLQKIVGSNSLRNELATKCMIKASASHFEKGFDGLDVELGVAEIDATKTLRIFGHRCQRRSDRAGQNLRRKKCEITRSRKRKYVVREIDLLERGDDAVAAHESRNDHSIQVAVRKIQLLQRARLVSNRKPLRYDETNKERGRLFKTCRRIWRAPRFLVRRPACCVPL